MASEAHIYVRHGGWISGWCREGEDVTLFITKRSVTVTISSINLSKIIALTLSHPHLGSRTSAETS